jgi:hypothetical protein
MIAAWRRSYSDQHSLPGKYRGKLLSAAKLRAFVEGTNKALAAGVVIPALRKHSPSSKRQTMPSLSELARQKAPAGLRRLKSEAGWLYCRWHIKDAPGGHGQRN